MEAGISGLFVSFKDYLQKDQELREEIKDIVKSIDQSGRDILMILQLIHKNGSTNESKVCQSSTGRSCKKAISLIDIFLSVSSSCKQAREILEKEVKTSFSKLSDLFKPELINEYYRYHDIWRFVCQRFSFIVALIVYLESGSLVSHSEVAETIGIHLQRENGFHLDLEDYLMGLLQLPSELSRLAVNCVIYGDYQRPIQISQFVAEMNAGFRLLNLKNDSLRKRFDGLKYDVKKIEEVVYDLSIRGLKAT